MKPEIQDVIDRLYAAQVENYKRRHAPILLNELRHALYQAYKSVEKKTMSSQFKEDALRNSKVTMNAAGEAKVYWLSFEEMMIYISKLYRLYKKLKRKMKEDGEWRDVWK